MYDIIGSMNHALDLAVLRGSVGTRHPKLDAVREEESVGGVIKLPSIITLDAMDGVVKLRGHKGKEVERCQTSGAAERSTSSGCSHRG
jgi:hypothetical protein